MAPTELLGYAERRDRIAAALRGSSATAGRAGEAGASFGLTKRTSNLFRDRSAAGKRRLDLGEFNHVLGIDTVAGTVEVEGLATYEQVVAATLPHGVMPAVVPQLKTITVGGAVAGVGIEATSFRHGLVHHTLVEFDVLLPDGSVVTCTPDNAHRDLFFGFPNSYGTLGYAVRLVLRTQPIKPFVHVEHRRFAWADDFFAALARCCEGDDDDDDRRGQGRADFVDGVVFDAASMVLSVGRFSEHAVGPTSDYTGAHIYYRSLLDKPTDDLRAADYLWRWDTDWFWCSRNFGAEHPLVRRIAGRSHLNSRTYTKLMRWNARWHVTSRLAALRGLYHEPVIQDVDVPIARAGEFLDFLLRDIGIVPVWICPIRAPAAGAPFVLYPLAAGALYVNFGFWDVIDDAWPHEPAHFNRLVEREVLRLGGIKSLYSDCFFTRETFDAAYGMASYAALKARYDPAGRALHLFDKCVGRR